MNTKIISGFLCCMIFLFLAVSCLKTEDEGSYLGKEYTEESDGEVIIPGDDGFETYPQNISVENTVTVTFMNGEAIIANPFENMGVTIDVNEQYIIVKSTITSTEVNYVLSGSTTNGSFKIYSSSKFGLVLNGVSIQSMKGAAINIQSGKKVSVTLVDETANRLVDAGTYTMITGEDMKAALFSEGGLVFNGAGSLIVYGNHKHAICSDDNILINSGTITINNAVKDGFHCNEYFQMDGGSIIVTDVKSDGVECEEGYMTINGGTIKINNSGQGGKGLKSAGNMVLAGGNINLSITGSAYYDKSDADIKSPAGIKCHDNMSISGDCILAINSTGSAGKGISVDGTLTCNGGTTTISTAGAIFKSGNLHSSAKAIKSKGNMTINSGTFNIKTSKDGAEGLESKTILTINGGRIEIEAYDDGINASKHIAINGGEVYSYSSGNDGIDSNGTLTIAGGLIVSSGTNSPEDGFDCDNNTFTITGGTAIGVGGSTSTPTLSACKQRVVLWGTSGLSSGQLIYVKSSGNTDVLVFKMPRTYSSTVTLVFTSNLLVDGEYTIYKGGNISDGSNFHGLYSDASCTGGTSATTFSISSMVTTVGNVNTGPGGGGGVPPGGGRF